MKHHAKIHTLPDGTLCVFVPTPDGEDRIDLKNIVYLEGRSDQTTFHLTDEDLVIDKPLMYWGESMMKYGFARPHNSFVINLTFFKHYQRGRGGYVVLTKGENTIPVSQRYRAIFLDYLNDDLEDDDFPESAAG
jgi:two-component system, LytTR family, response regulator